MEYSATVAVTWKLPEGLANVQVLILRYTARAQLYSGYMYDEYPPFDFTMSPEDPGGSPVVVNVMPALEDRNRLTVGLRLFWLIPAMFYVMLIGFIGAICWFLAFFAVLFTKPQIRTQSMTHIITIEYKSTTVHLVQVLLHRMRNGGFTGS